MMRSSVAALLMFFSLYCLAQENSGREPVPDAASQQAALDTIASIYKSDYENAKTVRQKQALAKKLLSVGVATVGDQAGRYVLLRVARDIAAQHGDVATAFDAIQHLSASFDVDHFDMKYDVVLAASKAAKGYLEHQALADVLMPCVDEAVDMDRFDAALSFAKLAEECAKRGRDDTRVNQIQSRLQQVEDMAADYQKVEAHQRTLASEPANPDASLSFGRYLCLIKGDWEKGLPLLAIGREGQLKSAAVLERSAEARPVDIADQWWEVSEGLVGLERKQTQRHAADWYRKALPTLRGLTKAKIQKRLSELSPEVFPENMDNNEAKQSVRHAIRFNGVNSYGSVPSFRYDGTKPITVEARILCTDTQVSFPIAASTGTNGISVQVDPRNWIFSIGTGQGHLHLMAGPIKKDQWIHLAGVFNGERAWLFINGKLRDTKPLKGGYRPADVPLLLGAKTSIPAKKTFYFQGAVKEVRISHSAKYLKDFVVPDRLEVDEDTILFLPFEEGKGNKTSDASGNRHTAQLSGCEWD